MKQNARPATAAEITKIVGPLDDAVLVRIETEATPAEMLEAFTWATAEDQIGTELEHRPRGVVARVYEILKREEPPPGGEDAVPTNSTSSDAAAGRCSTHCNQYQTRPSICVARRPRETPPPRLAPARRQRQSVP